jgi:hypothetical protein
MTGAEALTLQLLKQINQKLERVLKKLSEEVGRPSAAKLRSRAESAKEIAAMTPSSIQQTEAVELLHEDRSR